MTGNVNTYLENQVRTASPAKLVEMLYNRAIELLNMSVENIKKGDLQKAHEGIMKTQDIVMELNLSLDMEKGGEIAKNLRSLYNYFYRRLVEANISKDTAPLMEIRDFFKELLEVWKEAMKNAGDLSTKMPERKGLDLSG